MIKRIKFISIIKILGLVCIFVVLSLYIQISYAANYKKKTSQTHLHSTKKRTRSLKSSKQIIKQNIVEKAFTYRNTEEVNEIKKQNLKKEEELLSRLTCDAKYMRCMNKFCSNDKIGKCVCYEDNYTNTKDKIEFIDIDGTQIKKGFDLLNYSKNECAEFLNKCPDDRRGIFLKYKNFIQRDCLLLSDKIIEKGYGLATELKELEECMRPVCTTNKKDLSGQEDFSFAPFHLCFDELTAIFSMGAFCSKIMKKAKSPIALEKLFLDKMSLLKERSCISMGGIFSNDKHCYISISYGQSKDTITSTMLFPVGSLLHCTAETFGVELEEDYYAKQRRRNKRLKMAATAFTVAGVALSVVGSFLGDPIGSAVNTAIGIADSVVDVGMTSADYAKGKISTKNYAKSIGMSTMSIALSAMSFASFSGETGKLISQIAGVVSSTIGTISSIVEGGLTIKDCVKKNLSKEECIKETIRISAELAANILSLTSSADSLSDTVSERGTNLSNTETRFENAKTEVMAARTKVANAKTETAKIEANNALKVAEAKVRVASSELKIAQTKAQNKAQIADAKLKVTNAKTKEIKTKAKAELKALQSKTKTELKALKIEAKDNKIKLEKMLPHELTEMQKFTIGISATKGIIDITASATNLGMSEKITKEKKKEEELGLSSKPILNRNAGIGKIDENRETINGNCFLNGEFFATEEEQTFLLWKD